MKYIIFNCFNGNNKQFDNEIDLDNYVVNNKINLNKLGIVYKSNSLVKDINNNYVKYVIN